jgi:hypothetical protein
MAKSATPTAVRPHIVARYELDDDGFGWTIHIPTDSGDFVASATRLLDVELRAGQTIAAVLGLSAGSYDLEMVHVLNVERRTPSHI